MVENEPLDQQYLNVKDYFTNFIKTKKIDELIAYDNKLFSEVRNLESEKHVLVTQNYKKFVSATETINTIKSSLVGFEKDLLNLQGKVQNLVSNFNSINSSVDGKLKQTEEIYKIKKDLKRLKFISDLPNILEKQLALYLNDQDKNIKLLEKSLNYYQKCKEFLKIHKDNNLVKDIYKRTSELIYKYKSYITDEMNIPEFNEFHREKFETCLSLLVKINEDKTDLIKIFIERYQFLLSQKFDDCFSMKDGVDEIDFETYTKIYDNYEFAINENDFMFYEEQIKNNNNNVQNNTINFSSLSSKYFKKGTFIWICKQISETILTQLIFSAYQSYISLFGKDSTENLNSLLNYCITTFNKKVFNLLDKSKYLSTVALDPVFFKEGLLSFYKTFLSELIVKMDDAKIDKVIIIETILKNNKDLTHHYLSNIYCCYINEICSFINNRVVSLQPFKNSNSKDDKQFVFKKLNKKKFSTETDAFFVFFEEIIKKYSKMLKNLDLEGINEQECFGSETDDVHLKFFMVFFGLAMMIIQSSNFNKFTACSYDKYFSFSEISPESIQHYKTMIKKTLLPISLEMIYFSIFVIKKLSIPNSIKILIDRFVFEFQSIKKNKSYSTKFRTFIDKELGESTYYLYDGIIQMTDHSIFSQLKELFYDIDFASISSSPATFRKELKDLCYTLYQLKLDLMEILEEEAKHFQETKMSVMTESFAPLGGSKKPKNTVELEMEKLQIRRLTIYGEHVESPQMIIYVIIKIFLKTLNEMIKLKKFSCFGYQQVQIDLSSIQSFFKDNLVVVDIENIIEGFHKEIIKNCAFNTVNLTEDAQINQDLIKDIVSIFIKDFKDIPIVEEEIKEGNAGEEDNKIISNQ